MNLLVKSSCYDMYEGYTSFLLTISCIVQSSVVQIHALFALDVVLGRTYTSVISILVGEL